MESSSITSKLYIDQLKPPRGETRICVELSDTKEAATLVLGNSQVLKDAQNPDCKILMEKRVLLDLLERKADAFALAGRGKCMNGKRLFLQKPLRFNVKSVFTHD